MAKTKMSEDLWPALTYASPRYKWNGFFNGEGLELIHVPAAHTDGDTMVFFRYSDVLVIGDIISMTSYPDIDVEKGGSIGGMIAAIDKIMEVAMPQIRSQGGTWIIPGHGQCAIGSRTQLRVA
jgi:glyoxylase-like metal-dependent hydrolase (beta-lactamase superfamily II)